MKACNVDGCETVEQYLRKGMCQTHYKRMQRAGSTADPVHALGYYAAHMRVRRARGPASGYACTTCGHGAEEWAYTHGSPAEVGNGDYPYSLDPADYQPMCYVDHRAYDRAIR